MSLKTPSMEKCWICSPVPVAMTPVPVPELPLAMCIVLVPVDPFADVNIIVKSVPLPAKPGTMPVSDSFASTNPSPAVRLVETPLHPGVFRQ